MERIVAMVEGHLEEHFMRSSYANAIVQRCIPNGDDVNIDRIVDAILDQVEILDGSIKKVVVLFDREARKESSIELRNYVYSRITEIDKHRSFYIGIADREIENWILADGPSMRSKFNLKNYTYCGDGVQGKGVLKKIAKIDMAPRDKARLLKGVSPTRAAAASKSLSDFIQGLDFSWPWAES